MKSVKTQTSTNASTELNSCFSSSPCMTGISGLLLGMERKLLKTPSQTRCSKSNSTLWMDLSRIRTPTHQDYSEISSRWPTLIEFQTMFGPLRSKMASSVFVTRSSSKWAHRPWDARSAKTYCQKLKKVTRLEETFRCKLSIDSSLLMVLCSQSSL